MPRIQPPNFEETNPCYKEQKATFKCFDDHHYDKGKCSAFMENYKTCNKFWDVVKTTRRRQGIIPHLPPLAERDQIKKEFIERMKGNI